MAGLYAKPDFIPSRVYSIARLLSFGGLALFHSPALFSSVFFLLRLEGLRLRFSFLHPEKDLHFPLGFVQPAAAMAGQGDPLFKKLQVFEEGIALRSEEH